MIGGKSLGRTQPTALGTMLQASSYGLTIPTIFGTVKSPMLIIWAQNLRQGGSSKKGKKKGVTTYVENADFLLGTNPIEGVLQVWLNANRYPLNFVKQRSSLTGSGGSITITDSEFYFVVGVTLEVSLSGTFNDYGGQGSQTWGPTTYEYPLWNKANPGPDLANTSGSRWFPYTFKWVIGDGDVVSFPDFPAMPSGFVNIYYAQFSAVTKHQSPIAYTRMTFESELGNGPEFTGNISGTSTPLSSQRIIYPMYAGLATPDADLGASGALPDSRCEVKGSHALYSRGDADFMDMVEDILKSGAIQAGTGLSLVQRGLNLVNLPGPVQKDSFGSIELSDPVATFWQPTAVGSRLIAITRTRASAGTPTVADSPGGNTWNTLFANTQKAVFYSNPGLGTMVPDAVTSTPGGGPNFNGDMFIMELDPATTALDASSTNSGSGGGVATGSITTANTVGTPSFITAVIFCDNGVFSPLLSPLWSLAFSSTWTQVYTRTVYGPGTYAISVPIGSGTNWWVAMISFTQPQAPSYPNALGDILDPVTSAVARLGCRAGGLFGSLSMNSQSSASDWLKQIFQCANISPYWSGFVLKTVFRSEVSAAGNGVVYTAPTAAGPVVNITEAMLISEKGGPSITVTNKTPSIDAPNILQMEYLDRSGDYNPAVASWPETSTVSAYGPKKGSPQVLHQVMDPLVAIKLLAIQARDSTFVAPITYSFKGTAQLALLEPMDLVWLNDSKIGLKAVPARIQTVAEDDSFNLDITAEPFVYAAHAPDPTLVATSPTPYQPGLNYTPASVNPPIIFEPVPRLSGLTGPQLQIVISDDDPNYGGCAVFLSTDGGTSYNLVGTITGNAVTGITTADWPIATDPDTTHDLPVDLTESLGSLLSYQVADEDNFVYPCYIAGGNASIPYGLMTYAVATLTATNKYILKATGGGTNHLRRCVFGAPTTLTDVDHPNGSRWAFLNPNGQGILKLPMDPKWVGQTLHFKFLAFNSFQSGTQAITAATDYTYTPTGIPGQTTGGTIGPNNQYTLTGGALTNPTSTSIAMAQATAKLGSGLILNYNARTFTISTPTQPTTYYVTIADPTLIGDTGTGTTLTATCQTSNALVSTPGNIYIGSIQVLPAGGGTTTSGGGNPNTPILSYPYDVAWSLPGAPFPSTTYLVVPFDRPVSFAANFAGSDGRCLTNPSSAATFTLKKLAAGGGTSTIGTFTISTAGGFTFASTGGLIQTFATGDSLLIETGASDATLSDVAVSMLGMR